MDPITIMAILRSKAVRYLGAALIIILALTGTYVKGRHDGTKLVEAEVAAAKFEWQTKVAGETLVHQAEVSEITNNFMTTKVELEKHIRELEGRKPRVITKYIPVEVDAIVPKGFVAIHDRSATGLGLQRRQNMTAAEPSTHKLSDVASVVAVNYYQCEAEKAQLKALQEVIRGFQESQRRLVK